MNILVKVSILLIFLTFIESKYEIILDRVEIPLGDKYVVLHSNRVKKLNRSTYVLDGVWELKIPLDNTVILSFEAFNFAGGQYKKIFGRTLGPFCEILYEKHIEKDVRYWFSRTNLSTPYGHCPLPAGWINTKNWSPEGLGDYMPPYLPGNERWKLTFWFAKNGEIIEGYTFYAIVRDNQKLFESTFG